MTLSRWYLTAFVCAALVGHAAAAPEPRRTVVDGRHIAFTASADENSVDTSGAPLLTGYSLEIFVAHDNVPVATVDLGHPRPDDDGGIRLEFVSKLAEPLAPGVVYEAIVQAVGPYGTSDSARSNPFSFSGEAIVQHGGTQ
jgi:hypothetical protein